MNLINLTLRLGLLTPLHATGASAPPPPPPPPVVVVAPSSVPKAAAPVVSTPVVVTPAPAAVPAPATTTYNGIECVVTLTGPDGHPVTFAPTPADNGSCASAAQGWPSEDTVSVSAQPVTSTTGGGE